MVAPNTKGVSKIDSEPNLILFNNFLAASPLPGSSHSSVSNCVGPTSNISPKEPMSSISATKVSPRAPPITPAANLFTPAFRFNLSALTIPSTVFFEPTFAYFPAFFALIAPPANFCPSLKP